MTIQLQTLLDDLHEDHRNMSVLLDLLEREIARMSVGGNADEELTVDIMRYLTSYADAVHHPKEDILYARMRSLQPALANGLERVEPDHRRIAERGDALRQDIEASASGTPVERRRLVEETREYVRTLRRHMAWEEEDLFRRAAELLESQRDVAMDVAEVDAADPVFGAVRQRAYANLLQSIRHLATA